MIEFNKSFELTDIELPQGAVPFKMLWVEPGEFTMGSDIPPEKEERYMYLHVSTQGVKFQNIITKGFWLGQFVVTNAHWKALGNLPLF